MEIKRYGARRLLDGWEQVYTCNKWVNASWFRLQSKKMREYLLSDNLPEPKKEVSNWLKEFRAETQGGVNNKKDFGIHPIRIKPNQTPSRPRSK